MAAFMLSRFGLGNYAEWKGFFDSDPVGRTRAAQGHRLFQSVDDDNDVFLSVRFATAEEAKAFRERLLASGVLDRVSVELEPTVVNLVEDVSY